MRLTFLTKTLADALRTFFEDHASKGGEFKYFIHEDEVEFNTYRLVNNLAFERIVSDGAGDFLYEVDLRLERTK